MQIDMGYRRQCLARMPPGRTPPYLWVPGLLVSPHPIGAALTSEEEAGAAAIVAQLAADRPLGPAWIGPDGAVTPAQLDLRWLRQVLAHRAWRSVPAT